MYATNQDVLLLPTLQLCIMKIQEIYELRTAWLAQIAPKSLNLRFCLIKRSQPQDFNKTILSQQLSPWPTWPSFFVQIPMDNLLPQMGNEFRK